MAKTLQPTEEARVEDVESDDEGMPGLEPSGTSNAAETTAPKGDTAQGKTHSRSEKKSRKAVTRLGMKPYPGITNVKVKKRKRASIICRE